jgi:L-ascorbate metabolism protein UlaG (beta-lactamase superfamily)
VVEFGGWTVYHSGDTVRYPGMAETLRQFAIDVAILPINGSKPERRVAGNLNAREAAELGADIRARCVIPCHYEMFEFNTANPTEFLMQAKVAGVNSRVLLAGERWSSRELPSR